MPERETIAQKVAKHNKPGLQPEPDLRFETDEERSERKVEIEEETVGAVTNTTVGNLFDFSAYERARILVIITAYDKKVKATIRNAKEIDFSTVDLSIIRSRCAIITEAINKAPSDKTVTLEYPMRATLGSACSLYTRWIKKEKTKQTDQMIDTLELEKAAEQVLWIANKIGEQLTLFIDDEDNDEDAN